MKTLFAKLSVKASLLMFVSAEAFAAGPAKHAPDDLAHSAEHASAGLPQMDPTWFPSQIFWLAVTFSCLYVIFARKVLPEISSTLESRREQIEGDLKSAQDLKEEAEAVHQSYESALSDARKKSSESFLKAETETKAKFEDAQNAFRDRVSKESAKTDKAIAKAKDAAMTDMHAIAAEIASAAAEKIVGVSTDLDKAKSVVKGIDRKAA